MNFPKAMIDSSKIRVLVSGCLPPPVGGMATFYETLLGSSLPQRVDLSFVQTSSQKRDLSTSGRLSVLNLMAAVLDCWRFFMALLKGHPQITHIGTAFGLSFAKNSICILVARLFGCTILLHPHCSFAALYSGRPPWWQWFFRSMIRLVHGVIVLSQEWRELSLVVPKCKIFELPNGIDLTLYQQVAEKQLEAKKHNRPLQILYLGYLGKAKGTFDLLDGVQAVKAAKDDLHFVLIGSELTPGELQQLQDKVQANDLESYVEIHPPMFGAEKLGMLSQAGIFVYPSYHEGMPMAVIEAMACGLPIIASRVGGLPDLVTDGVNGLLVDPGCPEQIAVAVSRLADDPQTRLAMGEQSYQRATRDYDFESRVEQLMDIYSATLTQN